MKDNPFKIIGWILLAVFIAVMQVPKAVFGFREPGGPGLPKVRFGFSKLLLEDINPGDALAATLVWAETIGVTKGLWSGAEAEIFEDLPTLCASLNSNKTDVVGLLTQEYLELSDELDAEPALTYVQAGSHTTQYVLFANRNAKIETLGDLQNKKIAIHSKGGQNSLASIWCDVLLMENGLPEKEQLFRSTKEVHKASQAILPAFFMQVDAAITSRSALETATELNPQLGIQLKEIAISKPFVPVVVCMRKSLDSEIKTRYIEKSVKLHEDPNAFQTFLIFKVSRLMRWQPQYLESVKDLLKKHKHLKSIGEATSQQSAARNNQR